MYMMVLILLICLELKWWKNTPWTFWPKNWIPAGNWHHFQIYMLKLRSWCKKNYTIVFYLVQWSFQGTWKKFLFCKCIWPHDSKEYIPVYIPIPVYIFGRTIKHHRCNWNFLSKKSIGKVAGILRML